MNYLAKIILFSLIGSCLCANGLAQEQSAPSDQEARAVVATYLDALAQGDTFTIKQLLGSDYLQQRQSILDNPAYPNLLSARYSVATSRILATQQINQNTMAVDALIELSKQETLQCRFILAKSGSDQIKIIREEEHN